MFNLSGSEMVFIVLAALVLLGPEKLPEALRKVGRVYAEVRKIGNGFQSELRNAIDEPTRELRDAFDQPAKELRATAEQAKSAFSLQRLDPTKQRSTASSTSTTGPADARAAAPEQVSDAFGTLPGGQPAAAADAPDDASSPADEAST